MSIVKRTIVVLLRIVADPTQSRPSTISDNDWNHHVRFAIQRHLIKRSNDEHYVHNDRSIVLSSYMLTRTGQEFLDTYGVTA